MIAAASQEPNPKRQHSSDQDTHIDIEMPLLTYINSSILPSKSNQDRAIVGYSNAGMFDYMIVLDGHGGKEKELFVNHLMKLNWEQILTFHNS